MYVCVQCTCVYKYMYIMYVDTASHVYSYIKTCVVMYPIVTDKHALHYMYTRCTVSLFSCTCSNRVQCYVHCASNTHRLVGYFRGEPIFIIFAVSFKVTNFPRRKACQLCVHAWVWCDGHEFSFWGRLRTFYEKKPCVHTLHTCMCVLYVHSNRHKKESRRREHYHMTRKAGYIWVL